MIPAGYESVEDELRDVAQATRDLRRLMESSTRGHARSKRIIADWHTTVLLGAVASSTRAGDITPVGATAMLKEFGVLVPAAQITVERAKASAYAMKILRAAVHAADPGNRTGLHAWADHLAAAHAIGIKAIEVARAAGLTPVGAAEAGES